MIRRTPLKRGTKPLKRTPLRKVSKKRARDGKIYSAKRKAFLEANPICQVWLKENGWELITHKYPAYRRSETHEHFVPHETLIAVFGAKASCDVHHVAGRTGSNYLDESTWLAVCRENHERIHANPSWGTSERLSQMTATELYRTALSNLLEAEEHVFEELATLEFVRSSHPKEDPRRMQVEFSFTVAMLVHKHAIFVARDILSKNPA